MTQRKLETVEWHPQSSEGGLVRATAGRLIDTVAESPSGGLALSGGRLAQSLFRAVVDESRARAADWAGWHCFWADERCVPPGHPESNYRVALKALLEPLGWPMERIHRLRGEIEPEAAAAAGEAEMRHVLGADRPLDLVLLGMGEDGHVASLFPGREESSEESDKAYIAVQGPKPPKNRVTLTMQAIIRATNVWVVVSGHDKRVSLERALMGDLALPLGRILSARKKSQVFSYV